MAPAARTVAVTGSGAARATAAIYRGFAFRNTSDVEDATVRIFDNASAASGTLLETIELGPEESTSDYYDSGIWAENGIFVSVVAGAIEGSVRIG